MSQLKLRTLPKTSLVARMSKTYIVAGGILSRLVVLLHL